MIKNFIEKRAKSLCFWLSFFLIILAFSLPLSKTVTTISYILLVFSLSLLVLFSSNFKIYFFSYIKHSPLSKAALPLLLICFLGMFYSTDIAEAWGRMSNILNLFLIAFSVSILIKYCNMKSEYYLLIFTFSLMILCLIGLAQVLILKTTTINPFRPLGMHHIWFANLLSVGIYIAVILIFFFKKFSHLYLIKSVLSLFVLIALFSLIVSTCRGAWLAIIFTSFTSIFLIFIRKRKVYALLLFAILIVFICLASYSSQIIRNRIHQAISDIKQYQQGNISTSIGSRFLMWRASLEIFKNHPIFGVGIGDYNLAIKRLISKKQLSRHIARYNQPHNVYFFLLATLGVLGLLSFFWMIFVILSITYREIIAYRNISLNLICLLVTIHLAVASFFDTLFFIYTLSCTYGFVLGCTFGAYKTNHIKTAIQK